MPKNWKSLLYARAGSHNLQEINGAVDLEAGTFVYHYPWKTARENIVPMYSLGKGKPKSRSLITLKDWTAEEAEYQTQATEIKHGLNSGNTNGNCMTKEVRPMESTKLRIKRKGHTKFVVQAMLFGTVISLRVQVFTKNGLLPRS